MSLPSGFKDREDYNRYMRSYRARKKTEQEKEHAFYLAAKLGGRA